MWSLLDFFFFLLPNAWQEESPRGERHFYQSIVKRVSPGILKSVERALCSLTAPRRRFFPGGFFCLCEQNTLLDCVCLLLAKTAFSLWHLRGYMSCTCSAQHTLRQTHTFAFSMYVVDLSPAINALSSPPLAAFAK